MSFHLILKNIIFSIIKKNVLLLWRQYYNEMVLSTPNKNRNKKSCTTTNTQCFSGHTVFAFACILCINIISPPNFRLVIFCCCWSCPRVVWFYMALLCGAVQCISRRSIVVVMDRVGRYIQQTPLYHLNSCRWWFSTRIVFCILIYTIRCVFYVAVSLPLLLFLVVVFFSALPFPVYASRELYGISKRGGAGVPALCVTQFLSSLMVDKLTLQEPHDLPPNHFAYSI